MLCACTHVRGVYTSDNLYDFVTMPTPMRFGMTGFELSQWPEHYAWIELPQDLRPDQKQAATDRMQQKRARAALLHSNKESGLSEDQKLRMQREIDEMLTANRPKEEVCDRTAQSKARREQIKRELEASKATKQDFGDYGESDNTSPNGS